MDEVEKKLWEYVEFLYPYAKKAWDLEANKYPHPLFKFLEIEDVLKAKGVVL